MMMASCLACELWPDSQWKETFNPATTATRKEDMLEAEKAHVEGFAPEAPGPGRFCD